MTTPHDPKGTQMDTLPKDDLFQASFNLLAQDQFVTSLAATFEHWKGIPSPIGLKEKGSYRRSDALDTISSNGFIYKKSGIISAAISGNSESRRNADGGQFDNAQARIILPRFYDGVEQAEGNRIYLAPGDRLYLSGVETLVSTYQMITFNPDGVDVLQFPATCVEYLIDSQNKSYKSGYDFELVNGNIRWIHDRPAIDPDTGKGYVYGVRYLYQAYWYVQSLPNEIRVTQVTEGDKRVQKRMPYSAVIVREYLYNNQNNSDTETPVRSVPKVEAVAPSHFPVNVSIKGIN